MLPKIHKKLYNVSRRPFISTCGTPTDKFSEFLDNELKPAMGKVMSYIKDSNNFMYKIRYLKDIPKNAFSVTADPSIPRKPRLQALKEVLEYRKDKQILIKMPAYFLKNNYC